MIPFEGFLELPDGGVLEPDSHGLFRSAPDQPNPLAGADLACCEGWRSGQVKPKEPRFGTHGVQELARLLPPVVEVSLVSECCETPIPGALFAIVGKNIGRAVGEGTLQQAMPRGERRICIQHPLIPTCLEQVFTVAGPMCSGLKVPMPTDGMRLVTSSSGHGGGKDVWLVPQNGADAM